MSHYSKYACLGSFTYAHVNEVQHQAFERFMYFKMHVSTQSCHSLNTNSESVCTEESLVSNVTDLFFPPEIRSQHYWPYCNVGTRGQKAVSGVSHYSHAREVQELKYKNTVSVMFFIVLLM